MCIIAVCKRKLSLETLENCHNANPDGIGIAMWDGKKWKYKKGMMELQDFTKFYDNVDDNQLHVVHFRLASVGEVCPQLTHPFPITKNKIMPLRLEGEASVLLFHNGSILEWEKYLLLGLAGQRKISIPNDFHVMSDTRAFSIYLSMCYANKLYELKTETQSKYALCMADGTVRMFGKWEKEGKYWHFSNFGYKTSYFGTWRRRGYSKGYYDYDYYWGGDYYNNDKKKGEDKDDDNNNRNPLQI